MKIRTTDTATRCPHCGVAHECATGLDNNNRPTDGSISICIECAGVGIFEKEGTAVRAPTDDELTAIMAEPKTTRIIEATREFLRNRGKGVVH